MRFDEKTIKKLGVPVVMAEFDRSYLPNRVRASNGYEIYFVFRIIKQF